MFGRGLLGLVGAVFFEMSERPFSGPYKFVYDTAHFILPFTLAVFNAVLGGVLLSTWGRLSKAVLVGFCVTAGVILGLFLLCHFALYLVRTRKVRTAEAKEEEGGDGNESGGSVASWVRRGPQSPSKGPVRVESPSICADCRTKLVRQGVAPPQAGCEGIRRESAELHLPRRPDPGSENHHEAAPARHHERRDEVRLSAVPNHPSLVPAPLNISRVSREPPDGPSPFQPATIRVQHKAALRSPDLRIHIPPQVEQIQIPAAAGSMNLSSRQNDVRSGHDVRHKASTEGQVLLQRPQQAASSGSLHMPRRRPRGPRPQHPSVPSSRENLQRSSAARQQRPGAAEFATSGTDQDTISRQYNDIERTLQDVIPRPETTRGHMVLIEEPGLIDLISRGILKWDGSPPIAGECSVQGCGNGLSMSLSSSSSLYHGNDNMRICNNSHKKKTAELRQSHDSVQRGKSQRVQIIGGRGLLAELSRDSGYYTASSGPQSAEPRDSSSSCSGGVRQDAWEMDVLYKRPRFPFLGERSSCTSWAESLRSHLDAPGDRVHERRLRRRSSAPGLRDHLRSSWDDVLDGHDDTSRHSWLDETQARRI